MLKLTEKQTKVKEFPMCLQDTTSVIPFKKGDPLKKVSPTLAVFIGGA